MYTDCEKHRKGCPQCCIVVGGGKHGNPPLQPITVSRPFQILGIDIMDLPKTDRGAKHVVVIQDFLAKWPWVFPLPDQKTKRLVDIISGVYYSHVWCARGTVVRQGYQFVVIFDEGCL